VRTSLARSRERLDSYTLELQRHGEESVEREVRWLTELIDSERVARPQARGSVDVAAASSIQKPSNSAGAVPHGADNRE
jgi:hypothetical protein